MDVLTASYTKCKLRIYAKYECTALESYIRLCFCCLLARTPL